MSTNTSSALLVLDLHNICSGFSANAPTGADARPAQIDLYKLKPLLSAITQRNVTESVACTHSDEAAVGFNAMLRSFGYTVVTRPMRTFADGNGGVRKSCNMDAEIAVEAMLRSADHDTVILGSGDGDFAPLMNKLRAAGKDVYIASHARAMSGDMRAAVGSRRFIDLGAYHRAVRFRADDPKASPQPAALRAAVNPELGNARASGQAALVIDSQYLSASCNAEGWLVDICKFVRLATDRFGPMAHVTVLDREKVARAGFHDMMRRQGWRVLTKEEKRNGGCSTAVEMGCAAIEAAREGHSVVLCTGSGHHRHLVRRLRDNGCEVALAAPQHGLSHSLRSEFSGEAYLDVSAQRGGLSMGPVLGARPTPPMRSAPVPRSIAQINYQRR